MYPQHFSLNVLYWSGKGIVKKTHWSLKYFNRFLLCTSGTKQKNIFEYSHKHNEKFTEMGRLS